MLAKRRITLVLVALSLLLAPNARAGWRDALAKSAACAFRFLLPEPEPEPENPWALLAKKEADAKVDRFLSDLRARGVSGIGKDSQGRPVQLKSDGSVEIPFFEGNSADTAFGFTTPPDPGSPTLHAWALRRRAIMFKNAAVVPIPKDFEPLFAYPEMVVSATWKLAAQMDWAVANGKRVHFNLDGFNVPKAVATYGEKAGKASSTDWELGRLVFGIKHGHIPRYQVEFWNGERRLSVAEVNELLSTFP